VPHATQEWEASAAAPYERRGSLHRGMSRVPSFAAIKTSHSMLNVSHTGAMAHAASGDLDGQQHHAPANPWPAAAAEGYSADAAAPDSGASPTATAADRALSSGQRSSSGMSGLKCRLCSVGRPTDLPFSMPAPARHSLKLYAIGIPFFTAVAAESHGRRCLQWALSCIQRANSAPKRVQG